MSFYQSSVLCNMVTLSYLKGRICSFDIVFCLLPQYFHDAVQLCILVLSFCVKCRRCQIGMSRILFDPVHQAWAFGLEIFLQCDVETIRLRIETPCVDAELIFCILRLPSAAEAENLDAAFLTPLNLVNAASIALDILHFAVCL